VAKCRLGVRPLFVVVGPATVRPPRPADYCGPYWPYNIALAKSIELVAAKRRTEGRTDEETRLFVRPSVSSFVCLLFRVSVSRVHPMGTNLDAYRNLMGEGKIWDQQINTRNLVSKLSGNSLKLLPPDVTF